MQRGPNRHHYVNTPIHTTKISTNVRREKAWKSFKTGLMEQIEEEVATGGIGSSGGRIPVMFRRRDCAPGTKVTSRGRRRLTVERKRNNNKKVVEIDIQKLLERATAIQSDGALSEWKRKVEERSRIAGKNVHVQKNEVKQQSTSRPKSQQQHTLWWEEGPANCHSPTPKRPHATSTTKKLSSWRPTRRVTEISSNDIHRGRKMQYTGRWHVHR